MKLAIPFLTSLLLSPLAALHAADTPAKKPSKPLIERNIALMKQWAKEKK